MYLCCVATKYPVNVLLTTFRCSLQCQINMNLVTRLDHKSLFILRQFFLVRFSVLRACEEVDLLQILLSDQSEKIFISNQRF